MINPMSRSVILYELANRVFDSMTQGEWFDYTVDYCEIHLLPL